MKHKFLGSVVAAALMSTTMMAEGTMLQRFEAMEKEMNTLKAELAAMKAQSTAPSTAKKVSLKDDDEDDKPVKATSGKIKIAVEDDEDDEKPAKASSGKIKIAVEKDDEQKSVPEQLEDIHDQLSTLNKRTNGNAIKWDVDLRTSVDNINYKMADGSKQKNDALFTNRLWLGMNYAATKNLSFTGQLAYNKIFGQRGMTGNESADMEGFDWVSGESAYDDTLRVRSAYFYYQDDEFLGTDIPWTISIGRRPSTVGHLINLRENDQASSPLAHTVNVEFDGASAKFGMEEVTGLTGSYFKLCAGRGMSNAEPRFSAAPYSDQNTKTNNIDMAGVIIVPYDDKQYSLGMQYTYANNLIDIQDNGVMDNTGTMHAPAAPISSLVTVGGLHTATAFAMVNGIGEGWSEFLDDSMIFVSGAMSKTDPYDGRQMLGSFDSQTGYSYWIGTQFPSLISDEGRWGAEFNHGSNHWRPITYGEDTLVGSKIAARGNAYELYFTEPLVKDILSFQLRYTYIDYDYSGSNGFFGSTSGTPMAIGDVPGFMQGMVVDKAQDIRAYIRYKF